MESQSVLNDLTSLDLIARLPQIVPKNCKSARRNIQIQVYSIGTGNVRNLPAPVNVWSCYARFPSGVPFNEKPLLYEFFETIII